MQLLTALDEMFLNFDTSLTTSQTAAVAVFDDGGPQDRVGFVRARIAERLSMLPPLRWRLARAGLDRYWAESEVDLDYHVVPVTVPAPGGEEDLRTTLDEIMSPLLDRTRPLWRFFVIEGLSEGRYAYALKVSHGLVDGGAMLAICDLLADEPESTSAEAPGAPESDAQVLAGSIQTLTDRATTMMKVQTELAQWMAERIEEDRHNALPAILARSMPGELGAPLVQMVNATKPKGVPDVAPMMPTMFPPESPFNGTVTKRVSNVVVDLSLDDLRKIGKLIGGSINDALLAVTAGTLRRYMKSHGGPPDRPLLASTPISWRTGSEDDQWANQIWMLYLGLPSHAPDPIERLKQSHRAATDAKNTWQRMPGHLLRDLSSLMPGSMQEPVWEMVARAPAQLMPKFYNVCISNVRGPVKRPTYGGAPVQRFFVYGFVAPTCGLLVAGLSCVDRLSVSYTGCLDIVTDLDDLAGHTHDSLAELLELTKETAG